MKINKYNFYWKQEAIQKCASIQKLETYIDQEISNGDYESIKGCGLEEKAEFLWKHWEMGKTKEIHNFVGEKLDHMSNLNNTTRMESFIKEFIAFVDEDTAIASAQEVLRQANSALSTHVAILTGDLVTKEDDVTKARESLVKARVNGGEMIKDNNQYVSTLLTARNNLIQAEEDLKIHKTKLAFLAGYLIT